MFLSLLASTASTAAPPPVTAAAFAPDGKAVLVGSQAGIEVLSWPGLKPLRKLTTKLAHVHDLAFAPGGEVLAAAGGAPADEGAVELFRWPSGEPLRRVAGHADLVCAVAWRGDGGEWASASADGSCRVHGAADGKCRQVFNGHSRPVLAICYMPDGKTVLSAGIDQSLRLWEAKGGREVRALENHVGPVHALALRPAADPDALPFVASASADRTVRLWQPTIGRLVRFKRLPSAALTAAWSPGGEKVLVGCADGRLRVIDPDSLEVLQEEAVLKGWAHTLAVPAKGGEVLVGGERGQVKSVRLSQRTGRQVLPASGFRLDGHTEGVVRVRVEGSLEPAIQFPQIGHLGDGAPQILWQGCCRADFQHAPKFPTQ